MGQELKKLSPDAIVLDLHGSMSTTGFEDAEGDFLSNIRSAVGGNAIIRVGLDLHANITPQMLKAADICIACKNNPRDDYYGKKVVSMSWKAVCARSIPRENPNDCSRQARTNLSPLKEIHARASALENSEAPVVELIIYNVTCH
ncbi:M81 family metallopeptidase [Mesorhizobium australicum]|uniref:M81 family metallopeptidase n=1 Tax=Mesorhizobium australicum TaxID=536018 RepID=UPI00333C9C68